MKTSLIFLAACIIAAVSAYPAEEKAPAALNPVEDVQPVDQLTEDEEGGERVKRQYAYGGRGYGGYGGGRGYGGYGGGRGYGGYGGGRGYGGYGGGRGYGGYGGYGGGRGYGGYGGYGGIPGYYG